MPEIEPRNDSVSAMEGVHLFHAGLSNCSQRVRVALEERGVEWTSHLIDLFRHEQLTDEYKEINPKGVVPTLIHDGKVITESSDIIEYIYRELSDDTGPDGSVEECDEEAAKQLLELSNSIQESIKVLTFTYILGDAFKKSPQQLEEYSRGQNNQSSVDLHRKFAEEGFSAQELEQARSEFREYLLVLDQRLQESYWLSGNAFGLSDVLWVANVNRAIAIEKIENNSFQLQHMRSLMRWFGLVAERSSFQKAILDYLPK